MGPALPLIESTCSGASSPAYAHSLWSSRSGPSSPPRALTRVLSQRQICPHTALYSSQVPNTSSLRRCSLCCVSESELAVPLVGTGLASLVQLCRHRCSQPRD